jgi:hypothetical protein
MIRMFMIHPPIPVRRDRLCQRRPVTVTMVIVKPIQHALRRHQLHVRRVASRRRRPQWLLRLFVLLVPLV